MLGKAQFPSLVQRWSQGGTRQEEAAAGSELLSSLVSRANCSHVKGLVFVLIYVLLNIMSVVPIRPEVHLTQYPVPTVANRMHFPGKGDKGQFLERMIFPII